MSAPALKGVIALTISAALVASCASGPRKPSPRALKQIDRALANAPGKAQPSVIVKTELALSRSLREGNPKKAFQSFAAPTAQIHTEDGLVELGTFLDNGPNGSEGPQLETKSVYMSCDGSTAVSQGRLSENNKVGNYVIVWERQPGISTRGDDEETGYRYVYLTAAMDDPQPPRKPEITPGPDDIVVEALDSVRADIATCAPRDEIEPKLLSLSSSANPVQEEGGGLSNDRTMQLWWARMPDGKRRFVASLWRKDGWDTPFTLDLPSAP